MIRGFIFLRLWGRIVLNFQPKNMLISFSVLSAMSAIRLVSGSEVLIGSSAGSSDGDSSQDSSPVYSWQGWNNLSTAMLWNFWLPTSFFALAFLSNLPFYYLKYTQGFDALIQDSPKLAGLIFLLKTCFNAFFDPLVLINLYRDFDWAGVKSVMSLFGWKDRTDAYYPVAMGLEDNLLICARTAAVGLGIFAIFSLGYGLNHQVKPWVQEKFPEFSRRLLSPEHYSKEDLKKLGLYIFLGTAAACAGLLFWNIPGWAALSTYDLAAPTFINYGYFYMAVGLLEGFAQTVTNQLSEGWNSLFRVKFLEKLADSWVAGAWWNTAFLAQSIGYFGAPSASNRPLYDIAAFGLALGVASFNVLVAIRHSMIEAGVGCFNLKAINDFFKSNLLPVAIAADGASGNSSPGNSSPRAALPTDPLLVGTDIEAAASPRDLAAGASQNLAPAGVSTGRVAMAITGYFLAVISAATFAINLGGPALTTAAFIQVNTLGACMPLGILMAKIALYGKRPACLEESSRIRTALCCRSAVVYEDVTAGRGSRHYGNDGRSVGTA